MAEVVQISQAIPIDVTALLGRLTVASASTPVRLNDQDLAALEKVAAAPLPTLPPCDSRHFDQCLRILVAALPRKGADDIGGELMVAAYRRKLGHMPLEQINFMTDQALEQCKWFPTIMECLEIASRWERRDEHVRQQSRAIALVGWEKQARMEDAMSAMDAGTITQAEIDALPPRWQSIAETRGYLRRVEGGYMLRAPVRPLEGPAA